MNPKGKMGINNHTIMIATEAVEASGCAVPSEVAAVEAGESPDRTRNFRQAAVAAELRSAEGRLPSEAAAMIPESEAAEASAQSLPGVVEVCLIPPVSF